MPRDDDPLTTLSKWPFILGDLLLVATALSIAILADWQLSNWQVASCVMAVALGAGLFVLPYVVEYRVRVAEAAMDREADIRVLQRQLRELGQGLEELEDRSAAAETRAREAIEVGRSELEKMEARWAGLAKATSSALADDEPSDETAEDETATEAVAELAEAVAPVPKKPAREQAPPVERPRRELRVRHRPAEPRLLARAIGEGRDGSNSAVSRIIESKPEPAAAQPRSQRAEPKPTTEPTKAAAPEPADKPVAEAKPTKSSAPPESEPKKPAATPKPAPEPPEAGPDTDLLFDEDPAPPALRRKRVKKQDTVLTAAVFIGIGNKPFLRGSGAGLSWEEGQPMEFQEIGKWRWVAPEGLEETIEVQLFRNDTDPDQTGKTVIKPGQKVEVSPVF